MNMKIQQYIIFFVVSILLSYIYKKILKDENSRTSDYYYNMVNQYLLTNNSDFSHLGSNNKPYLWIHLHNDNTIIPNVNQRSWLNFFSRNSKDLNIPYQYLTIKSIVSKCGNDFNICLIDDESFKKILPGWSINLEYTANPIKTHLRLLALSNLLNTYGGLLVPSSFICFKSLKPLYDKNISYNKMFVGEFCNRTSGLSNDLIASPELMGCSPNNNEMSEFIKHLEILNSKDFVAEMDFLGKSNKWLQEKCLNNEINLINGSLLGTKNSNEKLVFIEELISSSFIDLYDNAFGLYIPWNELINRTKLEWFSRLSPEQVLESNTAIGKYLLINS